MEPNFELFEEGERSQAASGVHVTLNKECKLFFNRVAVEALGEKEGQAYVFTILDLIGLNGTNCPLDHSRGSGKSGGMPPS
jgi:hypothetical protein